MNYAIRVHYHRRNHCWSVHYRGTCFIAKEVVFTVPCSTRLLETTRNPRAFFVTKGKVRFETPAKAIIYR